MFNSAASSADFDVFRFLMFCYASRHSQIKMLCVHEAKHPDVQFVVAVRAFPAVNNILSLWVFLGQLETKSSGFY